MIYESAGHFVINYHATGRPALAARVSRIAEYRETGDGSNRDVFFLPVYYPGLGIGYHGFCDRDLPP